MITGPNIITDGLISYLDIGNQKSFRGEPTVNLLQTPNNGFQTQSHMVITTLSMKSPFGNIQNVRRFSHTEADPRTGDQRMRSTFTITDKNSLYTYSAYIYIEPGTEAQNTGQFWRVSQTDGNHWQEPFLNIISFNVHDWDKIGQWQRISVTFQPDSNNTSNTFNILYYNRVALGSGLIVTDGQMEQKPYATPFVNGTRGTTVETGGGLIDLSKNGNNGNLINGVGFNSDNFGSIVFDGVDDYSRINDTNYPVNIEDPFSVLCWVYVPSSAEWSNGQQGNIITRGSFAGVHGIVRASTNNQIRAYFRGQSSGTNSSSGVINRDEWTFCVATWDGAVGSLYINGVLSNSNSTSLTGGFQGGTWHIAEARASVSSIGNWFEGEISNVKIYNKALTPEEILQNYNATKSRYEL